MILIKSIPYDSYSISCAWVLFLKQQWSFKPLTRDIVRGEKINHWRLGTEWEQVLLLVNQLSVVLFKWVEICYFRPFWTGRQNQNCPNKIKGQILLWQILVSSVASAWKISKPQQLALPLVPEPQLIFPQLISNLPLDRETHPAAMLKRACCLILECTVHMLTCASRRTLVTRCSLFSITHSAKYWHDKLFLFKMKISGFDHSDYRSLGF